MRTILITGAGSGIGKAIAVGIAEHASIHNEEIQLFLIAKSSKGIYDTQKSCDAFGIHTEVFLADLSNEKNIEKVFGMCKKKFGTIDCLINNAGIGVFKKFGTYTYAEFDRVVSLNLKATFFLTQLAFEEMKLKKKGHVFFITSVASEKPFYESPLYCMTKYGLRGFIDVLRMYGYEHNIKITNILPGAVNTPMWKEKQAAYSKQMIAPSEIANAVCHSLFSSMNTAIEEIVIRHVKGDLQDNYIKK